eukprot:31889-Hanusia_phi.AAC.1
MNQGGKGGRVCDESCSGVEEASVRLLGESDDLAEAFEGNSEAEGVLATTELSLVEFCIGVVAYEVFDDSACSPRAFRYGSRNVVRFSQAQSGSIVHVALQPSPDLVFPSSHVSLALRMPFPHTMTSSLMDVASVTPYLAKA